MALDMMDTLKTSERPGDTNSRQYNEDEEEEEQLDLSEHDIEWMLQMEHEILTALKSEENDILLEYYESLHERELVQDMEATIEEVSREQMYDTHLQYMSGDDSKVVLCPLCAHSYLFQKRSVIFCNCGFRFDSKGDAIGLRHTKQALGNVMSRHVQSGCVGALRFETTQMFGSGVHLMGKCDTCNNFEIVM